MDYVALKTELTTDPLSLGLVRMSDQDAANKLNEIPATPSAGREIERDVVPACEIFEATLPSEWTALSATEKQRYQTMLSMGELNLKKPNTRSALAAMFGAGTTTRTNVLALQTTVASRAMVLFGEPVQFWDVARARAL